MEKYDFVVAGGGFAGVCAAICAAREGVKVLIVEKSNCFGGAAAHNLVNPFMAFWTMQEKDGVKNKLYLSRGIFEEITEKLAAENAYDTAGGMVFNEEYLKLILNRMVIEAGVHVLFHTMVTDVVTDGEHIKAVEIFNKSGKQLVYADYFADATGDADIAFMAGCPYRLGRDEDNLCQPMTLCFRLADVDLEAYRREKKDIDPLYKKFKAEGRIKNVREDVLIFNTLTDSMLHFNSTRIVKKCPVNAEEVTQAELEVREQVFELYDFLRNNFDAFKNSRLVSTALEIGVRESRMIDGEYILTADDIIECRKFEDSVAAGNYDIDIHNPEGTGTSHYFLPQGEYYTIPYRSLVPKKADNLIVAGRCISATHEAQASVRIMPICATLGQAAGCAAAAAVRGKTSFRDTDIKEIQKMLKAQNAFLG